MTGSSWVSLNFLWLVPAALGVIFVAAVLIYALWRIYRPPSLNVVRERTMPVEETPFEELSVDPGYAGSKPSVADYSSNPSRRRVP
jgi:hypothetical protein